MELNLMNKFLSIETYLSDDLINTSSYLQPTSEVFFFFCWNMKKLLVLSLLDTSSVLRLCPPAPISVNNSLIGEVSDWSLKLSPLE